MCLPVFIVTATAICSELFKCRLIICRLYLHCIIIIIIIIIPVITFMQDIYNHVRETNHVSRVYSVAAVLY